MDIENVRDVMLSIPDHFNSEKAKGVKATIQCVFTGEQASDWVVLIENQTCLVEEGRTEKPDLTLKSDATVLTDVLRGELDPMRAFLLGKVKVTGDFSLGMKLIGLVK
jgi:putative sterol carrier protein